MVWVTSKADASSMDQNGPLEVPLQVTSNKRFAPSGLKEIGIRKFEFVSKVRSFIGKY